MDLLEDDLPPDVHAMAAYFADGTDEEAMAEVLLIYYKFISFLLAFLSRMKEEVWFRMETKRVI